MSLPSLDFSVSRFSPSARPLRYATFSEIVICFLSFNDLTEGEVECPSCGSRFAMDLVEDEEEDPEEE